MTSKSSTSNGDDDEDYGSSFIPWLDLVFGVDNTSTDIMISNEELLTERYLKAGTLPAILRRLTLIETTSQSQIWAFLLHLRSYVIPRFIFPFLFKRYFLCPSEVDQYASALRNELFDPDVIPKFGIIENEKWSCLGPHHPHILEEDRHVIGPQYFWLATSSELSQHSDELSKRSLSLFCERDDMDQLMLESYTSIQLGVLLFLETWLQHFPEDFLLVTARVNSKFCKQIGQPINPPNDLELIREFPVSPTILDGVHDLKLPASQWTDDSDDAYLTAYLISFLREFSSTSMFFFLGGRVSKMQDRYPNDPALKRGVSSEFATTLIPQNSQLKLRFPCISNVLEIILSEDSLCSLVNQVISQPSPKFDQVAEKNRLSMRSSFFEKFIDSRLSDILEFEDDAMKSENNDFMGDYETHLITSSLGPEDRLSNGCTDSENFCLQIPCSGGYLNGIISSSLVSALTATSIELRSRFPLSYISYSQCQRHFERKWISDDTFMIGNNLLEEVSTEFRESNSGAIHLESDVIDNLPHSTKSMSIPLPLLGKITKALQIQREKALVDVYVAYSECAITLCAVELQIAQDYAMNDVITEAPLRIYSTTIDRQIIGYSGSKKKGLDQVAQLLRLHRSNSDFDSGSNSSDQDSSNSQGNRSPRKSMFSFMRRRSVPDESLSTRSASFSTQKVPPTVKQSHLSHLSPEVISQSLFLSSDEKILANNLTLRFHYLFCTIPMYEFSIDYSYAKNHKHTPMLNRFRLESEKLQEFVGNQILIQNDLMVRAEIIIHIIRVAEILAKLRSHHVLMMLIFALQSHSIHRLKTTWAVVHARIPGRWDILQDLVGFGGQKLTSNFCCRQSVEGVSEDIRNHLRVIIPNYVQMPETVSKYLDSRDVKTLQVSDHPEGTALSFGILASKEAFPTKGGISSGSEHHVSQSTNRSCSYADLQKSTNDSTHRLNALPDNFAMSTQENMKRQISPPDICKHKPKFVLKRRFSYPLSNKEISTVKRALNCHNIADLTKDINLPGSDIVRSSSTTTNRPTMRRLRTHSEIPSDDFDEFTGGIWKDIHEADSSPLKDEKPHQYRQYLLHKSFTENHPVFGTVRPDGLGEAGGTPRSSGKPCLPYLNGLLGRIIRLKEIPSFIKTELRQPTGEPISCYYCAQSPGNSPNDPHMLMINFGKLRAISNLLILIRSSQMTPYKFDVDFDIQYQCSKIPQYHGEDAMWERSKVLE